MAKLAVISPSVNLPGAFVPDTVGVVIADAQGEISVSHELQQLATGMVAANLPNVPNAATVDIQDVVDALVTLGLITQTPTP